jgi:hypothetical protein
MKTTPPWLTYLRKNKADILLLARLIKNGGSPEYIEIIKRRLENERKRNGA